MAGKLMMAAVMQDGHLHVGMRHGPIIQRMHDKGLPKVTQAMQGFVDYDGEFLSRREAYFRAIEQGQLIKDSGTQVLLSEMVW